MLIDTHAHARRIATPLTPVTMGRPFDDPMQMNVFRQVEEVGLPLTFHIAPKIGGGYGCYDEPGLPRPGEGPEGIPKLDTPGPKSARTSRRRTARGIRRAK